MVVSRITPFLAFLGDLEILPSASAGGVQVFGLHGPPRRAKHAYHTLAAALAANEIVVREAAAAREPVRVRIMNQGDSTVFLPAGERLPGAQRRWVLKTSLLLGAQETVKVPAAWIEAERESPPAGGAPRLSAPRDASGALFARGGRVVLVEIFDRKDTLRRFWPLVLNTLQAVLEHAPTADGPALASGDAAAWLQKAGGARVELLSSPSLGQSLAVRGDDFEGVCLLVDGEPAHVEFRAVASATEPLFSAGREVPGGSRLDSRVEGNRYLPAAGDALGRPE